MILSPDQINVGGYLVQYVYVSVLAIQSQIQLIFTTLAFIYIADNPVQ